MSEGLQIGVRAGDFGEQNCQYTTKILIVAHSFNFASHRQLRQHAVTGWCSVCLYLQAIVSVGFECHCL